MSAFRKVPSFYGKDSRTTHYILGMFAILTGFFSFYISISGKKNSLTDWLTCLLWIAFGAMLILAGLLEFSLGSSVHREKSKWLNAAASTQTAIVNREEVDNDSLDAIYYGEPKKYWHITLQMIPSQLAVKPEENLVLVSLKETQYKKYAVKDAVTIYYSAVDPFVFLLEDEV